jgi:hypothetical protein
MIIRNKFNGYSGDGRRLYPTGGGGSAPAQQTVTQTTIPEYAKPYVERMLGKAEAFTETPYQAYGGQRIAEFSPLQQRAFQTAANLGPAQQLGTATQMAGLAGLRAGDTSYTPGGFTTQNVAAPSLQNFQMGPAQQVSSMPLQNFQMRAAQTGFRPELQTFQMGGPERVAAQTFLGPGTAQAYMSPYQQAVTDVEKREATRASNIMKQQQQAQAVQQGAFGGARSGIVEAERQRNLAQQMGDIQARGSQGAFGQAQQQFNAEQQARLQAQQANQQAALATGVQNLAAQLGVQQLGTQTGLQTALANLSNEQQANVQNLAANLQTQGLNSEQALRAALANQQANLTTGQANLQALLGVQGLGAQTGMQAQLANQQAGMEAQRLSEQSRQFGANLGMQGIQQQLAAAGQLGALGQTQFGQEQAALQAQAAAGAQQQGMEQQKLTQAYQDFLSQRGHTQQQLSFMSDILRGGPLSQVTYQQYQAPPPMASQLAQLGLGAYGFSQLGKGNFFKEGGIVKGYADGGIPEGGIAQAAAQPQGTVPNTMPIDKLRSMLSGLSDEQLDMVAKDASDATTLALVREQQALNARMRNANILAEAIPETTIKEEMVGGGGLDAAPIPETMFADTAVGERDEAQMASGGIVAFAKGKEVKAAPVDDVAALRAMDPTKALRTEAERGTDIATGLAEMEKYLGPDKSLEVAERLAKTSEISPESEAMSKAGMAFEAIAAFGEPVPFATAFGKAGATIGRNVKELDKLKRDAKREADKLRLDTARYERLEKRGNYAEAQKVADRIANRQKELYSLEAAKANTLADIQLKEKQMQQTKELTLAQIAATRAGQTDVNRQALGNFIEGAVANFAQAKGRNPTPQEMAQIKRSATEDYAKTFKVDPYAPLRAGVGAANVIQDEIAAINKMLTNAELGMPLPAGETKESLRMKLADAEKRYKVALGGGGGGGGGGGAAQPAAGGLPMPSSKADLQKGQVYNTSRGPARWNGTAFEAI